MAEELQFTHLHVHTEYSLNDAMCKLGELVKRTKELGMTAIASTDHGNMFSLPRFYLEAKKAGIKPILGCEAYVCPEGQDFRPGDNESEVEEGDGNKRDRHNRHVVLLAKNYTGYQNLIQIISDAVLNGFYYAPRTDLQKLAKWSDGLICLTACLGGDVPFDIMHHGESAAERKLHQYLDIFGEGNVFLEVQDNGIEEQYELNRRLIALSEKTGVPLIATNDVHYIEPKGADYHDVLMAIQAKTTIYSDRRKRYGTKELYLKSPEQMYTSSLPREAMENTIRVAEMCNVELPMDKFYVPEYDYPAGFSSSEEFLRHLAYKGLRERYPDFEAREKELTERLEYELGVVKRMGYNDYFLIVWDYVNYALSIGAIPSPGRGSGAGSILAYCLYITHVDPIRHKLIFERFLSPERVSPPDIDWDIQDDLRQQVVRHVVERYGQERVSQIITFGTFAARASIRASGRALNKDARTVDELSKAVPAKAGMTIKVAMGLNPDLKRWYEEDPERREIIDTAMAIEGLPSTTSTHAAGILITPRPVTDFVPIWNNKGTIVCQYDMVMVETLGLLKADILGLKTLTVISNTLKGIERNYGISLTNEDLLRTVDDPDTFKLIAKGNTQGIFQLEGQGMTATAVEMQPQNVEEITALIALYRPGPMDYIPQYIANKRNPDAIHLRFDSLRDVLADTYGIIVYQEQVMFAAQVLAGYSMAAADELRKGTAKKKQDIIDAHRKYLIYGREADEKHSAIPGAISRGYDERNLHEFYNDIEEFAKYSFNKSHAAAYAYIACWTSWLKYRYPAEFMAALMTSNAGNQEKISAYMKHCRENLDLQVLPPSVNESNDQFTAIPPRTVRFALVAAKGVGSTPAQQIMLSRESSGAFRSFSDFVYRAKAMEGVDTGVIESLIRCGAFDEFGLHRSSMLHQMRDIADSAKKLYEQIGKSSQLRLFEGVVDTADAQTQLAELPVRAKLKSERDTVGIYLSGHPLDTVGDRLSKLSSVSSADFQNEVDDNGEEVSPYRVYANQKVNLAGIIVRVKEVIAKSSGLPMAFVDIEDTEGVVGIVVFPKQYEATKPLLVLDTIVQVSGKVSFRNDEPPNILADEIKTLESKGQVKVYVKIQNQDRDLRVVSSIVRSVPCHGQTPVYLCINNMVLLVNQTLWINPQGIDALRESELIIVVREE